ncbi:ATP-binding protein [Gaetbulibacter sp. M240]|uniref:PAS domain-containing hybrid sensor histidine kinase/response regulator n=1 Tax=Gaetbulibacter sp. M240 TaxID=3126511 RepID=UPI00374F8F71
MLNNQFHRLLRRQLKKAPPELLNNPEFADFLGMVDEAYHSYDADVRYIERISEENSKELLQANQKLIFERDNTRTQLENVVSNIGSVIFETDLKGHFTFLNESWANLTGLSVNESLGKHFSTFINLNDMQDRSEDLQILNKNESFTKFNFKHKINDKLMWFKVKSKLVLDVQGKPKGYIGSIVDITNLKETEIELKNANKAKDEFLSTMSHEIRTPLNAVTGLTNILLMEDYLPQQLENLMALKYSGEHLLGLINDLLDLSKINSGKEKLRQKDFSLNQFIESIKSDFRFQAEQKGVVFNVVKEKDIPDILIGDTLKLNQIIRNLLSNSLKFTEKGSIVFKIKNLGITNNKINLRFKVIDTGIGISKEHQKKIFESFVQANSETSLKYGGTGLGLAICKKLLNLQGSDLNVKSKLNSGSSFSFDITYKISNSLSTFKTEMVKLEPSYKPLDVSVLVAEDNKMNTLILKQFFTKWKVNFIIAENGEEAIRFLTAPKNTFDLILMDLQMPILNGYDATEMIRNLSDKSLSNIPIIALTAFAQSDIKQKTKRYKMNGFMGKPFNPEKLYMLLKSYSEQAEKRSAI